MYSVGLIGLGPMGLRHCEALLKIPNAQLNAVCDLVKENVDKIKDKYQIKKGYTSFDKMLEENSLDLLIVATNGPSHAKLVIQAAKNNVKRILCEKPMATCLVDAEEMIEVCNINNVRLAINHARRWMPPYIKLKKLLINNTIGKIRHITFEMAGGQMGSNGGHFWDLVRFLTDEEPSKIMGFIDKTHTPNPRGNKFKDPGSFGLLLMKDGCRVFYDMSEDYGLPFFVEIMGSVGRILIDEKSAKWDIFSRNKKDIDEPFTRRPPLEKIPFEAEKLDMILSCKDAIVELLGLNKISCTGLDGLKSLELSIAVHKSEDNKNQFISLPLDKSDKSKMFKFT